MPLPHLLMLRQQDDLHAAANSDVAWVTVYISDERDKDDIITTEKDLMLTKGLVDFMPHGSYFISATQMVSSLQATAAGIRGQ